MKATSITTTELRNLQTLGMPAPRNIAIVDAVNPPRLNSEQRTNLLKRIA